MNNLAYFFLLRTNSSTQPHFFQCVRAVAVLSAGAISKENDISQSTVATSLKFNGISNDHFVANFRLSVT